MHRIYACDWALRADVALKTMMDSSFDYDWEAMVEEDAGIKAYEESLREHNRENAEINEFSAITEILMMKENTTTKRESQEFDFRALLSDPTSESPSRSSRSCNVNMEDFNPSLFLHTPPMSPETEQMYNASADVSLCSLSSEIFSSKDIDLFVSESDLLNSCESIFSSTLDGREAFDLNYALVEAERDHMWPGTGNVCTNFNKDNIYNDISLSSATYVGTVSPLSGFDELTKRQHYNAICVRADHSYHVGQKPPTDDQSDKSSSSVEENAFFNKQDVLGIQTPSDSDELDSEVDVERYSPLLIRNSLSSNQPKRQQRGRRTNTRNGINRTTNPAALTITTTTTSSNKRKRTPNVTELKMAMEKLSQNKGRTRQTQKTVTTVQSNKRRVINRKDDNSSKRKEHNIMERERRVVLRDWFTTARLQVDELRNEEKASKLRILNGCRKLALDLQQKDERLEEEKSKLQAYVANMTNKLMSLRGLPVKSSVEIVRRQKVEVLPVNLPLCSSRNTNRNLSVKPPPKNKPKARSRRARNRN
ncbi:hypothetical protein CHUAL_013041 [Chamberlinius hualienensis]